MAALLKPDFPPGAPGAGRILSCRPHECLSVRLQDPYKTKNSHPEKGRPLKRIDFTADSYRVPSSRVNWRNMQVSGVNDSKDGLRLRFQDTVRPATTYFPDAGLGVSTFGPAELNFRVRNGNGCFLRGIITGLAVS